MKYLEEFSDPVLARKLVDQIHATVTQPWAMMEVCGGQTHTIVRHGIDQLLPDGVEMIHGPGCPVCVTPLEVIDKALEIASQPDVIFCSFGDMLRVPGSGRDLFRIKSEGGDVRVVYSPLDALRVAQQNPDKQVVFFGIGFETTAPPNAMTVYQAKKLGIPNFSLLVSHVRVPPAIEAIMQSPVCRVQGFLAAGHVCSVMGTTEYPELADKYGVPIVVTGFEPLDILAGILRTVSQLEQGRARGRERLPACGPGRGQPGGQGNAGRRVRDHRPGVAGDRHDPAERLATVRALSRVRRGVPLPGARHRHPGVDCVPQRRGAAGSDQAARVFRVRDALHAAQPARRHDGVERGRVCGVLPLPPAADAREVVRRWLPVAEPVLLPDFDGWTCPMPLRDHPTVVMGHGGGGQMSAELIEHLFVPAFANPVLDGLTDSAVFTLGDARLAFSTDSFVVQPLFFPGGSIGHLAVNGTVNDLAMSGAQAAYLSCGFILEEGVELSVVGRIATDLGAAAAEAGVTIATGDTKVVDAGHGDGVYINTAGVGLVPAGVDIRPQRAAPGDVV